VDDFASQQLRSLGAEAIAESLPDEQFDLALLQTHTGD
jgi:hypothetical protein